MNHASNKQQSNNSIKIDKVLSQLPKEIDSNDIDIIFDTIEGKELSKGKYQIGSYLDRGQHGLVYEVTDTTNVAQRLVSKV